MGWLIAVVFFALVAAAAIWVARLRTTETIFTPAVGLEYRDGRFVRLLPPGRYTRFDPSARTTIVKVSTIQYPMTTEIPVISVDQFAFKLALAPSVTVNDPQLFHESQPVSDSQSTIYVIGGDHPRLWSELSAVAVAVVGKMRLADILTDGSALPDALRTSVAGRVPGCDIDRVLVTAINLPPETRKMITDVERAKFEALASVERARGEQAAMRVLANAARSMKDNPALANLRLLKAIETSKGPTTIVMGNPPGGLATP
jgi:regulator of protease activity HflC (stomatin/prohibitin superfamily)